MADWDDTISEYGVKACMWALQSGQHPRFYNDPAQGSLDFRPPDPEPPRPVKGGKPDWPFLTRRASSGEWYVVQNGRTVAQGFDNEREAETWIKDQTK